MKQSSGSGIQFQPSKSCYTTWMVVSCLARSISSGVFTRFYSASKVATTFVTHRGLYQYKPLMFGVTSAPTPADHQRHVKRFCWGCQHCGWSYCSWVWCGGRWQSVFLWCYIGWVKWGWRWTETSVSYLVKAYILWPWVDSWQHKSMQREDTCY